MVQASEKRDAKYDSGGTPRPKLSESSGGIRNDWTSEEISCLFSIPFNDLLFEAQKVHRHWFDPNQVQLSTLLSIKTGGCPPATVRSDNVNLIRLVVFAYKLFQPVVSICHL